ncbi:serine hydrolase [Kineococcus sp. SYSU DK004]|uniref:serine hydrolase n=1 Tax=Kineococcus sp. SYSU DK004 TaxID=3383125 RepID=UPI003D7EDAD8
MDTSQATSRATATAVTAPAPGPSSARDPLLDGLRTVALVRVVLWHAVAAAWLSWVFPAMPVMFFLAGSLLAVSVGRRGGRRGPAWLRTAAKRARRLLVPFWVYAVAVVAVTYVTWWTAPAGEGGDAPGRRELLPWVLPLLTPVSPEGQQGWLTSHLWYVTDYLWLLLLAPVVLWCARGPARTLGTLVVALAGLAALEVGPQYGWPTLAGWPRTAVGDLLCYGSFAVLGAAWARSRRARSTGPAGRPAVDAPRRRVPGAVLVAAGAALVAGALALTRVLPLERWSLNNSWLLLALASLGWLLGLAAFERPLRALSGSARLSPLARGFTARAVTIYLWHPAMIVLARTGVDRWGLDAGTATGIAVVLAVTAAGTLLAVLALGWVEDLAGGRPPRLWPGRRGRRLARPLGRVGTPVTVLSSAAATSALVVALAGAFQGGLSPSLGAIPGPSDREALGQSAFSADADPVQVLPHRTEPLAELPADALQQRLDEWVASVDGIDAGSVAVVSGDAVWEGTTSSQVGEGLAVGQEVQAASLTKSVTAALVLQEWTAGTVDIDAPVPDLPGIRVPADLEVPTPRQLMRHAGGLLPYQDSPAYDPEALYSAEDVVQLSLDEPQVFEPGTSVAYSNSGYLWLGLLLEDVTGQRFGDLVAERLAAPLGLTTFRVDETELPGWVGSSSGGLWASPGDLARWYSLLVETDAVLTDEARREMLAVDDLTVGTGIWPFCLCGTDDEGRNWAAGWGQLIAAGGAIDYPAERVAVMAYLLPEGQLALDSMPGLAGALLEVLPGRQLPDQLPEPAQP